MQNYKEKEKSVSKSFNQAVIWGGITLVLVSSVAMAPVAIFTGLQAWKHYEAYQDGEAELEKMRSASRSNKESKPSLP